MFRRTAAAWSAAVLVIGLGATVIGVTPAAAGTAAITAKQSSMLAPADSSPIEGTPVPLPFGTFSNILNDPSAGKIFYSGTVDTDDNSGVGGVAVSGPTGADLHVITGTTDAYGLVIGPDGLIYAAETNDIVAIDPATATVTHHYPVGTGICPGSIAFSGSRLWFSYPCTNTGATGGIGELDPSTGTVVTNDTGATSATLIAGVPGKPDELVIYGYDGSSALVTGLVSGTTLTVTDAIAYPPGTVPNLSVSPDGSTVLAGGTIYDTDTLSYVNQYSTDNGDALETGLYSADGNYVAFSNSLNDVGSFEAAGTQLRRLVSPTSSAAGQSTNVAPSGLAWVGTTLAAVFLDLNRTNPVVSFVTDILQAPSTVTISAPATTRRATRFSFTGQLNNIQDPAGLKVSVSRRDASGLVGLAPLTLGSGGTFTVTDTPPVGGTNVYTVSYAGSLHIGPAKQAVSIVVSRDNPALTVYTDKASYPVGATMTVTAHLGLHYNSSLVSLYATPIGAAQRLIARGNVNAAGNLVVQAKYSYSTSYIATFGGDYRFANSTVSTVGRVVVRVTPFLRGGYATSGAYTLFHASSYANPGAQILPIKPGQCGFFTAQYYSGGQWHNGSSLPCARLSSSGVASGFITEPAGLPWRVQVGHHSDASNVGAVSAWMYLRWV